MSYASDVLRSGGDADCTGPAELIGHPARSAMLLALLDGRALPMSMLASEAGVAASTARAHLSRLVDGGLLEVSRQGRHRYYAIASPDVARTLAALADRTGPRPVRSMRAGTRASTLRVARTCYGHVAGHLGVALMKALLDGGAVTGGDGRHDPGRATADRLAAAGRDVRYVLTADGRALFATLEVVLPAPSGARRPATAWTGPSNATTWRARRARPCALACKSSAGCAGGGRGCRGRWRLPARAAWASPATSGSRPAPSARPPRKTPAADDLG
ncbi:MAG TPA: helix-turn-helix transcriptional regulator [Trebonia sp.]|nr:helix-turn-helix transcriptional regulator [Trebonia sp.]